jgi:hypothetical protein
MRRTILNGSVIAAILGLATIAYAQQPPRAKTPDRAPPADAPVPRVGSRSEDEPPPPPAKGAARRPRGGSPDDGPPEGGPRGFGGSFGARSGGPPGAGFGGGMRGNSFGGFGGGGYGMPGPGMPGMGPGGYGAWPAGDDPEMQEVMKQDADLERQAHEMAEHVRQARGEERSKVKADLTKIVNTQFEVRQKRRQLQLKRMEEELQRLRDAISKRNDSRESIVENHIRELVGEPRDLDF